MTYKSDDPGYEDMGDLALSEHIEWGGIESNEKQPEVISKDALDIYDSYYE